MNKTFTVLGSSGQIGAALTEYLRKKNCEVIEFDVVKDNEQDLRKYNSRHLDSAVAEADFVFFLAFDVGGSRYLRSYQDTYDFVSNNLKLMDRTFDALRKHQTPFLFASSQMANMSYSSYGRLKGLGETMTRILGGLVVKFWNVYGIEHDLRKSHVITDLIIKAVKTGKIELLTNGREERQFLYADDCSACLHLLAEEHKRVPRDAELHVTSFEWHSVLRVAEIIARHFPGTKIVPGERGDEVQQNARNEPDPFVLGYWKPETSLADGIARIIDKMNGDAEHFFS
jgi:nucleoside-diphosphate-sugar epimerase